MTKLTAKQKKSSSPWPRRLKAIRAREGLTQRKAAEKIGAAVRSWIGWENGQRSPGSASRRLIELTFGSGWK